MFVCLCFLEIAPLYVACAGLELGYVAQADLKLQCFCLTLLSVGLSGMCIYTEEKPALCNTALYLKDCVSVTRESQKNR